MSQFHEITYTCPYCGKSFSMTVYDSVSVKQDPDLRDRCISGDIFQRECPHCHSTFLVQNDLIYTDQDNKFALWLSKKDLGALDLSSIVKPLLEKGFKLRRCATVQEFTEKIQILEDGMDDILVELAKYDCFIEFVDNKKGTAEEVTSVTYQSVDNGIVKINVRTDDKGMAFIIPIAMLEEERDQNPELYAVDENTFPLVNSDWIISLFTKSAGRA